MGSGCDNSTVDSSCSTAMGPVECVGPIALCPGMIIQS